MEKEPSLDELLSQMLTVEAELIRSKGRVVLEISSIPRDGSVMPKRIFIGSALENFISGVMRDMFGPLKAPPLDSSRYFFLARGANFLTRINFLREGARLEILENHKGGKGVSIPTKELFKRAREIRGG